MLRISLVSALPPLFHGACILHPRYLQSSPLHPGGQVLDSEVSGSHLFLYSGVHTIGNSS